MVQLLKFFVKDNEKNAFRKKAYNIAKNKIFSNLYIVYCLISFVTVLVAESFARGSVGGAFSFLVHDTLTFIVNFFIVLSTVSIAHLLKRRNFFIVFIPCVWIILSIISFIMYSVRFMPFTFNDILVLPNTFTVLPKYLNLWQMILVAVAICAIVLCVIKGFKKVKLLEIQRKKMFFFPVFMIVFTLVLCVVARSGGLINNKISGLANKYEKNGFVYCFASSVFERGMKEPDEYSAVEVANISNNINKTDSAREIKSNIIFLQLESFFDVNNIKEFTYSENPIPVFTSLQENFSHGYLTVPTFSAATANTEFEVISGMNVDFFGIGEIAYRTVIDSPVETVCHTLKRNGYTTHAIHNNNGTFYNRNEIYRDLGFDTFTPIEYMYEVEYNILDWARDKVITSSIEDCLDSTQGTDMIYAVGVQAHGTYSPNIKDSARIIDVQGIDDQSTEKSFEYYISQIKEVDTFVGEVIDMLKQKDEPTVLVVFGDHLPGFDVEDEQFISDNKYQTEYVMWTNFDMDYVVKDLYSYQLYSYVLEWLGIEGGTLSALHREQLNNPSDDYMTRFEILQYDILEGENTSFVKESDTQMGVRKIETDLAYISEGKLVVEGSDFTPFSKIVYDEKVLPTQYINKNKLVSDDFDITDDCNDVCVAQCDDALFIYSHTNFVDIK